MSDELKPALTPEEWRDAEVRPAFAQARDRNPAADAIFQFYADKYGYADYLKQDDLPKVIALANAALPDDSPYKITPLDVERLRNAARSMRAGIPVPAFAPLDYLTTGDLLRLADKLAAILPPETPT